MIYTRAARLSVFEVFRLIINWFSEGMFVAWRRRIKIPRLVPWFLDWLATYVKRKATARLSQFWAYQVRSKQHHSSIIYYKADRNGAIYKSLKLKSYTEVRKSCLQILWKWVMVNNHYTVRESYTWQICSCFSIFHLSELPQSMQTWNVVKVIKQVVSSLHIRLLVCSFSWGDQLQDKYSIRLHIQCDSIISKSTVRGASKSART